MSILLAVLAAAALFSLLLGLRAYLTPSRDLLQERLAAIGDDSGPSTLRDVELSLPILDRTLRPLMERLGGLLARYQHASSLKATEERIDLAGRPRGMTVGSFLSLRLLGLVVGIVLGIVGGSLTAQTGALALLLPIALGAVGYMTPKIALDRRIKRRQKQILRALPSSLDLLTICVEAGLSFDAALARVTERYQESPLAKEFAKLLSDIRLGQPREAALQDLVNRTQIEELATLVQAIIQSNQLGVGIASVLRIQSDEIRRRRRQRAEEAGQKAPIKMLIPMVGCIFPTLFVVLLGPGLISVIHTLGFRL